MAMWNYYADKDTRQSLMEAEIDATNSAIERFVPMVMYPVKLNECRWESNAFLDPGGNRLGTFYPAWDRDVNDLRWRWSAMNSSTTVHGLFPHADGRCFLMEQAKEEVVNWLRAQGVLEGDDDQFPF